MLDVSNPGSFEDVVELLIPELQRRGIYWEDYAVPGGTARENLHCEPEEKLLAPEHPGAKLRWNALPQPAKEEALVLDTNGEVPAAATEDEADKTETIVTVGLVKNEVKAC
jgi:hypothetical protein